MLLVTNKTITNQKLVISKKKCQKVSIFSLRGQFKPLKQLFESLIKISIDVSTTVFSDMFSSLKIY